MAAAATARRISRHVYLGLILLFLAGVLVQAMLAGVFLLGEESSEPHIGLGWMLSHMVMVVILVLSFFLGGGRRFWITSIVWGVVAAVQPILATLDNEEPNALAALHVPNALVLFALTLWLAWRAWGMAMEKPVRPAPAAPKPVARAPPVQAPTVRR